jgi:hypothetical protein
MSTVYLILTTFRKRICSGLYQGGSEFESPSKDWLL